MTRETLTSKLECGYLLTRMSQSTDSFSALRSSDIVISFFIHLSDGKTYGDMGGTSRGKAVRV